MTDAAYVDSNYFFSTFAKRISFAAQRGVVRSNEGSATASALSLVESDPNTRPLVIEQVRYQGRVFRFRNYLEVCPTYNETGDLLCLEYKPLGIHVFADTREGLGAELAEQVCVLWDEYACEEDANLSPAAIRLKMNLLKDLEEV